MAHLMRVSSGLVCWILQPNSPKCQDAGLYSSRIAPVCGGISSILHPVTTQDEYVSGRRVANLLRRPLCYLGKMSRGLHLPTSPLTCNAHVVRAREGPRGGVRLSVSSRSLLS